MLFSVSKLAWVLAQPGTLLVAVLVGGALLVGAERRNGLGWRRRIGSVLLGLATAAVVVLFVAPVGVWLLRPLEARFPAPEAPARVDGVVVLGGGADPVLSAEYGQPAVTEAAERLFALVALRRRYPQARILYAGGSGSVRYPALREAPVVAGLLAEMGVAGVARATPGGAAPGEAAVRGATLRGDDEQIVLEGDSRNTFENAVFGRALMQPVPGEVWLLVTSAYHMPRAVGVFRAAGWPVVAWPVDYRTTAELARSPPFDLAWSLAMLELAVHEWVGLFAYWRLGRTEALFPEL